MGLLYTKLYLDFEPDEWKQISSNPITYECLQDNVTVEILDPSQKSHRVQFKKGAKIKLLRVVGKFRITWDDEDSIK